MREIKFRAWHTDEMFYDVQNTYDQGANGCSVPESNFEDVLLGGYNVMQYTGLTDENGKEIYEGDIVKSFISGEQENYEIIFDDACFICALKGVCHGILPAHKDVEVLGNIYENPELLENKPPHNM